MIVVATVTQTCCACPNTFTGITTEGDTIFARYRWGHLSIRFLPAGVDDASDGSDGKSIIEADYGGQFDGFLNYDELRSITRGIIQWPKTCG
jgi:hypothetical protein